ncbi:serine--tRNA ligase [Candidatus Pacearchaeota archaeon]|nr:serine--tRNA ligase [Candidatus Pacearchaeota archaeon]MBD3283161.1 serine--tRNA ligase [Candidatus Pacearchaeota archaeon]
MIDIKLIRENPEIVKENIKKKFQNQKLALVDKIKQLDEQWRKEKYKADQLRRIRNELSQKINKAKKDKDEKLAKKLIKTAQEIPEKIKKIEEKNKRTENEIWSLQIQIPNIIHKSVPIGKDDNENKEIEKIGKIPKFDFKPKNHIEIGENLKILDFDTSAETSGKGFYYLKNQLAIINQALIRFGIEKMTSKGFVYIETPYMLRKKVIDNVTDLFDQQNQIYKIEGEDLYLIGTSEHSLIGRFIDTVIPESELPIMNTSYSMCFRKEIGAHGIEEKGLYRTHQFNKIEMIVICKPEESMNFFEKMKNITVEIFKDLKIPVRVLEMCSGDLGELKHKQIDVEAWSPVTKKYYEVGSCSNLTEAQARKLKIRTSKPNGEKYTPHTLNNTAIATSRALVAILENFQQKDGSVKIPKALWRYTGFKEIKPEKHK